MPIPKERKMSETVEDRLWQAARAAKFKRPTELARAAGLNPITVASYMRSERQPSLEACYALGKVLGVDPFWILKGKGAAPEIPVPKGTIRMSAKAERSAGRQIPLYSCALAGPDGSVAMSPDILDMIDAPAPIAEVTDAYAVRVSGESMEPRYEPSEIVYCHPRMPIKKGDYVVAQIINGKGDEEPQGYVKRFLSIDDNFLLLEQLNPPKKLKFQRDRVKFVHRIVLAGI